MTDSLSDLDLEFFSSGQLKTAEPHRRSSSASSHLRSPTRAPSAPVLAPPVASTGTSADAPGFDLLSSSSSSSTSSSTPARVLPARSNSYASLATLSLSKSSGAKWVASLLPTALSAPSASIPNTNLLPESPSALAGPDGDWPHHGQTIPPYNNNTHNRNHSAAAPHPTRAPVPVPVPDLTHFTPFGAKPTDAYAPPSGAPGFRGAAAYDWDKGYSRALERDLGVGAHERTRVPYADFEEEVISDPRRPSPANGNGRGNGQGRGGGGVVGVGNGNGNGVGNGGGKEGVGVLLDKKMSGVISLTGRREGTVGVLTQELVALIHAHLPALLRLPRQWTLFYSLDQHGISLNTLYARCAPPSSSRPPHPKGALVVMQDAAGMLFGVWVADGLRRSTRGGYYGGGESFLWRYLPSSGKFDVYKWTGKNDYVALCEEGFISFGGGDGHYGLYLDESLFDGSSARCPTFDNEPLCSGAAGKNGNIDFECVGLEVWGVGP
ncbi:TLD-domain-containing protein [Mycena olivaceomarginata]|nr:TLD-domain-containing protein [Mycena olivaceomarginata]